MNMYEESGRTKEHAPSANEALITNPTSQPILLSPNSGSNNIDELSSEITDESYEQNGGEFNDTLSIQPSRSTIVALDQIEMVSGYGQYHTNDFDPDKPDKKLAPYVKIKWSEITSMAKTPPSVSKEEGQWFIPSTLASRRFKAQEADGDYWVLCFDFDENTRSLDEVVQAIDDAIGIGVEIVTYTSRSATKDLFKCRALIPLKVGLSYQVYKAVLTIINDSLDALGFKTDRALERAGQVVYLPNKGAIYEYGHCEGELFNPEYMLAKKLQVYCTERQIKHQTAQIEREARNTQALAKRQAITTSKYTRPIDAFNDTYTVDEMLTKAGYDFDGVSNYRHPRSESGSYSASVLNGRVFSLSPNDPLHTADASNGAHDAFSAFCTLFHGGDQNAAITDAGNNMLLINGEPWNKVAQQEFTQQKNSFRDEANGNSTSTKPFSLEQFALNGTSAKMREKMLADKFILGRLAILGQLTLFSAPPNAGKTLLTIWLLRRAINAGDIAGSDVFYINADDNYKGLVTKLSIAEACGFRMLAPSHNNFELDNFLDHIKKMVASENARGKVLILDTVKKFTDVMDKKTSTEFGKVIREFASHGGSVIMLGHTNKHRGSDGKVIVAGTSDLVDDADCVYRLDAAENKTTGETTVMFENIKSRGDVAQTDSYCYRRVDGQGYQGLLSTVRLATDDEVNSARKATAMEMLLIKNNEVIFAILDSMKSGIKLKTEIIKDAAERSVVSKGVVKKVLVQHTGDNFVAGHRWKLTIEANNAHVYKPHPLFVPKEPPTTIRSYSEASNGE